MPPTETVNSTSNATALAAHANIYDKIRANNSNCIF